MKNKWLISSFLFAIVIFSSVILHGCGPGVDAKSTNIHKYDENEVYVRIPRAKMTAEFLKQTAFNVDHKASQQYAFGFLDRDVWQEMQRRPDFDDKEILELDFKALYGRHLNTETLALENNSARRQSFAGVEGYHDYDALTQELASVATYPQLASLHTAGQSVEGRELWYLRITDQSLPIAQKPKFLYIANMHGNETTGRESMIYLSRLLLKDYSTSPRIKNLLANAEIFIMPSMNPDGFENAARNNANGINQPQLP